jgi:hypothetical protein
LRKYNVREAVNIHFAKRRDRPTFR